MLLNFEAFVNFIGYGMPFANLYLKVRKFLKPKIKVNQQQNCDIYNQLTKST